MFTLSKRIESIWHFGTPLFFAEIRSNLSVKMQQKANCYKWDPSKMDFHFQAPWSCWRTLEWALKILLWNAEMSRWNSNVDQRFLHYLVREVYKIMSTMDADVSQEPGHLRILFPTPSRGIENWVAFVTCYTPCWPVTLFFELKSCLSLKTIL